VLLPIAGPFFPKCYVGLGYIKAFSLNPSAKADGNARDTHFGFKMNVFKESEFRNK
jgi:hypothetical protein